MAHRIAHPSRNDYYDMYIHEIRDQPCAHNPERPAIPLVIAFVAVWVVMQGQHTK
jgi:hypothetical protein